MIDFYYNQLKTKASGLLRSDSFLLYGLMLFGVLSIFFAVMIGGDTIKTGVFVASALKAESEVIATDEYRDTYILRLRYYPKGSKVPIVYTEYSSGYLPVGHKISILYNPNNPSQVKKDSFTSLWITPISGALVLLVQAAILLGIGYILSDIKDTQEWLKHYGKMIQAKVNHAIFSKDDGSSYWRIHAQWENPENGKIYVFTSDPLSYDPSEILMETVNVKIDPTNPKRYSMDISFLPQRASIINHKKVKQDEINT